MEAPILGLLEPEGEVSGNCMQAACLPPVKRSIKIKEMTVSPLCQTGFNPNSGPDISIYSGKIGIGIVEII